MAVGNATVTVGGGTAVLTLPDIEFTLVEDNNFNTLNKQKNNEIDDEYGWNVNGGIEVPTSGYFGAVGLHGFYANIEDDDTVSCTGGGGSRCGWANIVASPLQGKIGSTVGSTTTTDRDVDHWGVAAEGKRYLGGSGGLKDQQPRKPRYVALGADVRAIEQDIGIRSALTASTNTLTYNEDLDAYYYGGYLAWGGDYSPMLFSGLWQRWGLQSSFRLQGGVYYVDADYDGSYASTIAGATERSTLSLSENDVAFIGGLTLETRKKIGPRATLALRSIYEYYSWVPDMAYRDNEFGNAAVGCAARCSGQVSQTSIGDDDAFALSTSLRLTVGLGPDSLYQ